MQRQVVPNFQIRRRLSVVATGILSLAGACLSVRPDSPAGDARAMQLHVTTLDLLDSLRVHATALHQGAVALSTNSDVADELQLTFIKARAAYKRAEFWIEWYMPFAAEQLNGAPIDQVNLGGGPTDVEPARGFQVVEELLFPVVDTARLADIQREADVIRDYATRVRVFADSTRMRDEQVFDALRLEIARIATLGVTGFDSPVRKASLDEAQLSLEGIQLALQPYRADARQQAPAVLERSDSLMARAPVALSHNNFDGFDRLSFFTTVSTPLAHAVAALRDSLGISIPPEPRLWRASVPSPFDSSAFDPLALCAGCDHARIEERAALGEKLFFDVTLSGSGQRSCATCHQPEKVFTDGATRSASLTPGTRLRNAPTLINAALQWAQFTDLRAVFLEDQVADVVASPAEMHGVLATTVRRFRRDSAYDRAFRDAFPVLGDSAITAHTITIALAAYIRSLTSLESRADRAMRGDVSSLTPVEKEGFNVFAGKGLCATCHFLPLTNGTVPPVYITTEQEVLGVPRSARWSNASIDPDPGRGGVTAAPLHQHAFKTPGLRNVALTAPYMHNGVYRTLEEVIRFYNVGGGAGIGIHLPNQTLPPDSLRLSDNEQRALVAFLGALTDTTVVTRLRSGLKGSSAQIRGARPLGIVQSFPTAPAAATMSRRARLPR